MGDVLSLVEKAQEEISEEDAMKLADKMAGGKMNVDDFIKQLKSIRRMGSMKSLLGMIPGVGAALKNIHVDDKQFDRIEAIASSMTKKEREDIKLLGKSRIKRIANGSGTNQQEVNRFVKQFQMMKKMSKQMSGGGMAQKMAAMQNAGGDFDPSMLGMGSKNSTKTQSLKKRFKQRKRK